MLTAEKLSMKWCIWITLGHYALRKLHWGYLNHNTNLHFNKRNSPFMVSSWSAPAPSSPSKAEPWSLAAWGRILPQRRVSTWHRCSPTHGSSLNCTKNMTSKATVCIPSLPSIHGRWKLYRPLGYSVLLILKLKEFLSTDKAIAKTCMIIWKLFPYLSD